MAQLSRKELARRVVPKPKPCTEGEVGVNAQTGSESNIVNVKYQQQKYEMKSKLCVKCAKLKSVRCADCVRRNKSDVSVVMRRVSQFQDGIMASSVQAVSKKKNIQTYIPSENIHIHPNNYFVGKVGREENTNNLTPTKRKLILEKQVSKLVPVFDFGIASVGESESPAKRRKYAPGVN